MDFRSYSRWAFRVAICFSIVASGAPLLTAQVVINEVVTDPQCDWNDTAGGNGVPFDADCGTSRITDSDEWIELLNVSASTVDLTSWSVEMIDTTSATQILGHALAELVFTPGSTLSGLLPGGRCVIGNPLGAMNNDCLLVLTDGEGRVIHKVELGAADFDGDGVGNNAPAGDAHGAWDEAVARTPDGAASGDPSVAFRHARASIGAPNPEPPPRATFLINEVVTDPQRDWNDTAGGNGIPFDKDCGTSAVTDSDEWVELVNVSLHPGSLVGWQLVMHDTTPATETLGAGAAVIRSEFGSPPDDILPGEHVVIGNPLGSMNNSVWVRLLDDGGGVVDEVELGSQDFRGDGPGNEAPNGNATGSFDEAVARLPDAWYTGNNAADFQQRPSTIGQSNSSTEVILWQLYR